ncbi:MULTISPECIES: hypothetical protein [unclassified Rhizobium]|nr:MULTISPECIES: hypothetical protein [unclassified Rhizobium]
MEPAAIADLHTITALERAAFDLVIPNIRPWRLCHALPRAAPKR